jgi:hypothetical protein
VRGIGERRVALHPARIAPSMARRAKGRSIRCGARLTVDSSSSHVEARRLGRTLRWDGVRSFAAHAGAAWRRRAGAARSRGQSMRGTVRAPTYLPPRSRPTAATETERTWT